jgi:HTH-type transcriptional regulator / antitoxin HigA
MKNRKSTFHPGEYIADELEARGWSQSDLAKIIERPFQHVNLMVNGKRRVTVDAAVELAAAFGTSVEVWLNLQARFDAANAKKPDPKIIKRAKSMAA